MPNNFFQFKQFIIYQDACAMKVCTDACLFGAYIAESCADKTSSNCLDIGTGTGLLSLMLAQKTNAKIDAVEIDGQAYQQAAENFGRSPWKERLTAHHSSIQQFSKQTNEQYDLIISNPPFYENDLKSADGKKNNAKHDSSLTLQELAKLVDKQLSEDGIFYVLLPFHRIDEFEKSCTEYNLSLAEKILVKQTPKHTYFRGILSFSRKKGQQKTTELIIKNEDGNYTNDFTKLLEEYYLNIGRQE